MSGGRPREHDDPATRSYVLDRWHRDKVDAIASTTDLNKSEVVRTGIELVVDDAALADENKQLREENNALQQRVEELEAKVNDLEDDGFKEDGPAVYEQLPHETGWRRVE